MMFYAISPQDRLVGVANYPDEAVDLIDRFSNEGPTTWSSTGQQIRVPSGEPTGWKVMKESLDDVQA